MHIQMAMHLRCTHGIIVSSAVVIAAVFAFKTARFSCVATTVIYLSLCISLTLICSPISLCCTSINRKRHHTPPADMCDSLRLKNENLFSLFLASSLSLLIEYHTNTCVCAFSMSEDGCGEEWEWKIHTDSEMLKTTTTATTKIFNYARVPCACTATKFKSICAKDIFKKSVHK